MKITFINLSACLALQSIWQNIASDHNSTKTTLYNFNKIALPTRFSPTNRNTKHTQSIFGKPIYFIRSILYFWLKLIRSILYFLTKHYFGQIFLVKDIKWALKWNPKAHYIRHSPSTTLCCVSATSKFNCCISFIFIDSVIAVLESEGSLKMEINGNVKLKTQLCRKFMMQGTCNLGTKCNYAHGYSELRESPKLCRMFSSNRQCSFGNNCRFLHSAPHHESAAINLTPQPRKFFYPISRLDFYCTNTTIWCCLFIYSY
jgi:hypothetical protein